MITIHRSSEAGLQTVERKSPGCWIDVVDPSRDEVASLEGDSKLPDDFIRDALDATQVPMVEQEDGALLILVRIPCFKDEAASVPYATVPLGIVMTGECVVTICRTEHDLLQDLPPEHERDLDTTQPERFVLHLLWSVANRYLVRLREIEKTVDGLEDRLQQSLENREVLELLRYQKSLVHFTTSLHGNKLILERLRDDKMLKLANKEHHLFEDVLTENREAVDTVEVTGNILGSMMDAFASIISNNLNVVMKFLTSITVVIMIPTLVGSLWGMNLRLPLEDNPLAFSVMTGVSLIISVVVALIFWKKRWL